eukprot:5292778-Lingulodinium_polyedra.AAC.1
MATKNQKTKPPALTKVKVKVKSRASGASKATAAKAQARARAVRHPSKDPCGTVPSAVHRTIARRT